MASDDDGVEGAERCRCAIGTGDEESLGAARIPREIVGYGDVCQFRSSACETDGCAAAIGYEGVAEREVGVARGDGGMGDVAEPETIGEEGGCGVDGNAVCRASDIGVGERGCSAGEDVDAAPLVRMSW